MVPVVELMSTRLRQDVSIPVKTKKGNEFWMNASVGIVANNIYHPSETLTGFQTYESDCGS